MKVQIYAEMPNGQRTLKIPSPWSQLAVYFALLGGMLIAVPAILAIFQAGTKGPLSNDALKLEQVVSSIIFFGGTAYFYARMTFSDRPLNHLGLRPAHSYLFYVLAIIMILAAAPLYFWLGQLNKNIPFPGWVVEMENSAQARIATLLTAGSPLGIVINFIVLALLPAIVEEACFRGALQRILIQCFKSPWLGIVVTAFLFSAIHFQFLGFLPRMFLGILLGALYWYSGSLWVSILAHFITNAGQLVLVLFIPSLAQKDPIIPFYAALISLLIVVGLLFVTYKRSDTGFAKEYGPFD